MGLSMADADLIVANGTLVNEGGSFTADVVVAGERIIALALDTADWVAQERIDASGLLVIPGGIDVHTHFEEPDPNLLEGFASGGGAAAAGGLTTVVEMPQAHPTTTTPEQFAEKRELVARNAIVDMALWAGAIGPPQQSARRPGRDGIARRGRLQIVHGLVVPPVSCG